MSLLFAIFLTALNATLLFGLFLVLGFCDPIIAVRYLPNYDLKRDRVHEYHYEVKLEQHHGGWGVLYKPFRLGSWIATELETFEKAWEEAVILEVLLVLEICAKEPDAEYDKLKKTRQEDAHREPARLENCKVPLLFSL